MDDFRTEMWAHYHTANGAYHTVINPTEEKTSGNHHVINTVFLLIVIEMEGRPKLIDREIAIKYISATRQRPGIFNRTPGNPDRQTHDDVLAIAVQSRLLALPYAEEIWNEVNRWQWKKFYGIPIPVKYYYDNENKEEFEFRKWFGRFPWLIAVLKACASKELNLLNRISYCLYLLLNKKSEYGETSGKQLRWITLKVMNDLGHDEISLSIASWRRYIVRTYEGGMKTVLGIYHGFTHPFSKFFSWKI